MMLLFAVMVLTAGDGLRQDVIAGLTEGTEQRSEIEIALIAEGVAPIEDVQAYASRYREFYANLSQEKVKGKGRKLAKSIQKNLLTALAGPGNEEDGLAALIERKEFTSLTASFVYVSLATEQGVAPKDFALDAYLKPYLAEGGVPEPRAILAAHLVQFALNKDDSEAAAIGQILRISSLIAPDATYGTDSADKLLYQRAFDLFDQQKYLTAGHLALGGAARWPQLEAWQAMCYNVSVNLLRANADGAHDQLIDQLQPYMGQYRQRFATALASQAYNRAAVRYNKGDYAGALVILEGIVNASSPADFKKVLANTYYRLLEDEKAAADENQFADRLAKLASLDPEKAEKVRQRHAQLQLAAQVDGGNLEEAYQSAAGQLDTEIDRSNFESVLLRLSRKQRESWAFQEALDLLDSVPAKAQLETTVGKLRLNTYTDWLATFDDDNYKGLIRLYARIFADKKLTLNGELRSLLQENYGNALHREITVLIEERAFKKADTKSKAALKVLPGHGPLQEQRKLVETIMKRIAE